MTNERLPGALGGRGSHSVGGLARRHFAAPRVAIGPTGTPVAGPGALGACGRRMPVRLATVKHKLGAPSDMADLELVYGHGCPAAATVA